MNKKPLLIVVLIAAVVLFLWLRPAAEVEDGVVIGESDVGTSTDQMGTTTTVGGVTFTDIPEGVQIEAVPISEDIDRPDTERVPDIAAVYQGEDRARMLSKITMAQASAKAEPEQFRHWLGLAALYYQAQDYVAAEEVYLFLSETNPTNSITFHNLGNLYALHLKDAAKAETNYRQALKNSPGQEAIYRSLYEFYMNMKSDEARLEKGEAVLLEGIKAIPEAIDLRILLGGHYLDQNDNEKGKEYYDEAGALLRQRGDISGAEKVEALADQE